MDLIQIRQRLSIGSEKPHRTRVFRTELSNWRSANNGSFFRIAESVRIRNAHVDASKWPTQPRHGRQQKTAVLVIWLWNPMQSFLRIDLENAETTQNRLLQCSSD